jgi:hypothetical protein
MPTKGCSVREYGRNLTPRGPFGHLWRSHNGLSEEFRDIGLRFVDSGRIATAGGLTSGIDMALHISVALLRHRGRGDDGAIHWNIRAMRGATRTRLEGSRCRTRPTCVTT